MPRSPKPEGTKLQSYRFELANYEFLVAEGARLGIPWGQVFNQQLWFLRNAGLPPYLYGLFEADVERIRSTPRQELMATLWRAAMQLPPYSGPVPELAPSREKPTHITSINMTAGNRAYLERRASEMVQDFTTTMNHELHFARTFGLSLYLERALLQHLERTDQTAHEWATAEMYERVLPLKRRAQAPGVPPPDLPTGRA